MTHGIGAPDASLFKVNERPREYRATFTVTATFSATIMADSEDDADRQAGELALSVLDGDCSIDIDEVEEVEISSVKKAPKMYLVTDANGQKCQKSFLEPGDQPRELDERGF